MIDREKIAAAIEAEIEDDLDGPEEYRAGVARGVADVAIAAVLEQLREPTAEMVRAGGEVIPQVYPDDPRSDFELITEAWQAMLAAAKP